MNSTTLERRLRTRVDLAQVIEPLASYICAADQPRAALVSALAILVREVETTNGLAIAHFRALSEHN